MIDRSIDHPSIRFVVCTLARACARQAEAEAGEPRQALPRLSVSFGSMLPLPMHLLSSRTASSAAVLLSFSFHDTMLTGPLSFASIDGKTRLRDQEREQRETEAERMVVRLDTGKLNLNDGKPHTQWQEIAFALDARARSRQPTTQGTTQRSNSPLLQVQPCARSRLPASSALVSQERHGAVYR